MEFWTKRFSSENSKKLVHDMNFYLKPYKIKMHINKNFKKVQRSKIIKARTQISFKIIKLEM